MPWEGPEGKCGVGERCAPLASPKLTLEFLFFQLYSIAPHSKVPKDMKPTLIALMALFLSLPLVAADKEKQKPKNSLAHLIYEDVKWIDSLEDRKQLAASLELFLVELDGLVANLTPKEREWAEAEQKKIAKKFDMNYFQKQLMPKTEYCAYTYKNRLLALRVDVARIRGVQIVDKRDPALNPLIKLEMRYWAELAKSMANHSKSLSWASHTLTKNGTLKAEIKLKGPFLFGVKGGDGIGSISWYLKQSSLGIYTNMITPYLSK
jgi:hypothetical protein